MHQNHSTVLKETIIPLEYSTLALARYRCSILICPVFQYTLGACIDGFTCLCMKLGCAVHHLACTVQSWGRHKLKFLFGPAKNGNGVLSMWECYTWRCKRKLNVKEEEVFQCILIGWVAACGMFVLPTIYRKSE